MRPLPMFVFASMLMEGLPTIASAGGAGEQVYLSIQLENVQVSLTVGVDDGRGFSFATVEDDDGDGLIELPRGPVPGSMALGVTPAGGTIPGCDIWDFQSNGVSRASVPLFINALASESVGVDYGVLMSPPLALTAGQRFTIADGVFPGWPNIRIVDESGVAGLEEFVREVDRLPNFNGEVVVSATTVHFTLVPEPGGTALAASGVMAIGSLYRRGRSD